MTGNCINMSGPRKGAVCDAVAAGLSVEKAAEEQVEEGPEIKNQTWI